MVGWQLQLWMNFRSWHIESNGSEPAQTDDRARVTSPETACVITGVTSPDHKGGFDSDLITRK